jgi:uncharacterized protein YjbI with pentapeptide repeats
MSLQGPSAERRRLSQAELDLLISGHEWFIAGKPGGKRLALPYADLSRLNLNDRNLSDAELPGCRLDGCAMQRVRLERANLFGCDLR